MTKFGIGPWLTVAVLIVLGAGLIQTAVAAEPPVVGYEYEVKAEQVEDYESVTESIEYDSLTEKEQAVLFDAFKKSDHFLGGAEATVEYDERLDPDRVALGEWQVVRVNGVPILVAISEPEPIHETLVWPIAVGVVGMLLLTIGLFGLLAMAFDALGL